MAAGRNDDPFRGDPLAGDLHGMRIDQHSLRVEYRRAGASQKLAVDAFEASDFAVFGGDQLAPVVRTFVNRPAEARRVIGPTAVFASLHQQFFRHAADIDASAAPKSLFGDADTSAMSRGYTRAADPGRTAADDKQIEVHAGDPLLPGPPMCGLGNEGARLSRDARITV